MAKRLTLPRSAIKPAAWRIKPVEILGRWSTIGMLLVLVLLGGIFRGDTFLTWTNATNILTSSSSLLIVATGLTMLLVAGEFDLSIAVTATLGAVLSTNLIADANVATGLAVAAGLAAGLVVGLANGLLVTWARVHSFVGTLATSSIVLGLAFWISEGTSENVATGSAFVDLGRQRPLLDLPLPVFIAAGVALAAWFVLTRTVVGRYLYAIGGNPVAAYVTGIPVNGYRILAFMISGFLSALGGILLASRLAYSDVSVGNSFLLPAFAAGFIGASTIKIGEFHIFGTVVGVILLQIILVLVVMLNWPTEVSRIFEGSALAAAVALANLVRSRS